MTQKELTRRAPPVVRSTWYSSARWTASTSCRICLFSDPAGSTMPCCRAARQMSSSRSLPLVSWYWPPGSMSVATTASHASEASARSRAEPALRRSQVRLAAAHLCIFKLCSEAPRAVIRRGLLRLAMERRVLRSRVSSSARVASSTSATGASGSTASSSAWSSSSASSSAGISSRLIVSSLSASSSAGAPEGPAGLPGHPPGAGRSIALSTACRPASSRADAASKLPSTCSIATRMRDSTPVTPATTRSVCFSRHASRPRMPSWCARCAFSTAAVTKAFTRSVRRSSRPARSPRTTAGLSASSSTWTCTSGSVEACAAARALSRSRARSSAATMRASALIMRASAATVRFSAATNRLSASARRAFTWSSWSAASLSSSACSLSLLCFSAITSMHRSLSFLAHTAADWACCARRGARWCG
mmetsp:Transcript_10023/g.34024  ORF Transcript_10023/g.34024 Transcript_10023/m.34024 type:complete len:420 (-) Transcript_10023:367-1626(-)